MRKCANEMKSWFYLASFKFQEGYTYPSIGILIVDPRSFVRDQGETGSRALGPSW